MNRRRLGIVLAALAIGLTAGCMGGSADDSSGPGPTKKTQAPRTLADFKTSPDQAPAGFEPPADLAVSDPSFDTLLAKLSSSLSGMLEASFTDPNVSMPNPDERTYRLVFDKFTAVDDKGNDIGSQLYDAARKDDKNVGRLGFHVGSTFPADAQPRDSFIYKVVWRAGVKNDVLTVEAQAWAGYDTGGLQPVLFARNFKLAAERTGGTEVNYRVTGPGWGGQFARCRAVVDGVLEPDDERMATETVDAYRAEFADPTYRPITEAFTKIAAADGSKASEETTRQNAQKCVDEAEATPAP